MDLIGLGAKINNTLFADNLGKDKRYKKEQDPPMLGSASQLGNWESESARIQFHKNLSGDAAALCAYVYSSNPLTRGKTYKSKSGNWIPYGDNVSKSVHISNSKNLLSSMSPSNVFSKLKGRLRRERTGFGSMLFYQKGENSEKIVRVAYVTEGSGSLSSLDNQLTSKNTLDRIFNTGRVLWDRVGDWVLSNVMQGLTGLSPQHTFSIQNAKILNEICKNNDIKELYFFGHSLGGGLAVSNALATMRPAIVFDMAGLHLQRLIRYKKNYDELLRQHNILSYYYEGEALSSIVWTLLGLKHNGNRYAIENDENTMRDKITMNFGLHSLDKICDSFGLKEYKILEDEAI